MTYLGVNYIAVALAAFASFFFGAAWYMSFSRPWLAASEFTPDQRARIESVGDRRPAPFLIAFAAQLVMAYVFAALVGHLGQAAYTLRGGLLSGFLLWLGFVATTLATNNAFGMRKPSLTLIDGGHWLGVLLIQGAIIGLVGR
jgi:hypothetical protein